jgi:hypothetical protein
LIRWARAFDSRSGGLIVGRKMPGKMSVTDH